MKEIFYQTIRGKEIALVETKESVRIVHPWKNKDGSINWFNIFTGGSWKNLIIGIAITILLLLAIWEFYSGRKTLLDCFRVPGMLDTCKRSFGGALYNIGANISSNFSIHF